MKNMETVKQKLSRIKKVLRTYSLTTDSLHVVQNNSYGFTLTKDGGTYYENYSVAIWVNEDILTNKFTVYGIMDSHMFTNTFMVELLNYKSKNFDTLSEAIDELYRFIIEDLPTVLDTHNSYVKKILDIQKEANKNFKTLNEQLKNRK
jgi:hypothetical protein